MRADKFFSRLAIAGFVFSLILLSGCNQVHEIGPDTGQTQDWEVCGNNVCYAGEEASCPKDCTESAKDQTDLENDETMAWIEKMKKERLGNSTREQDPAQDILPNPGVNIIEAELPEVGFVVRTRQNLLSINENISSVAGKFSAMQFREVLSGGSLQSNTEAFGPRFATYEQLLSLKSGKVSFGYDEDTELISSYLEYEQDAAVIEYQVQMRGGVFKFFEGEMINFLGHEYIIEQVTNTTILLIGTDGKNEILLRSGHSSIVNGEEISPGTHAVNVTKDMFKVRVKIDDDIKLLPGQSLTQYVSRRKLMTNRLDVVYEGLTESPSINLEIRKAGENYRLSFQNNLGINYTIPLATISPFSVGNEKSKFVYIESGRATDYSLNEGDYFIINNAKEIGGITTLLKLSKVDYEDKLLAFEDPAMEKFYVYFEGNVSSGNANADLLVYGVSHKVHVGQNKSVSIDLNGDKTINGARIPVVAMGNSIIRFDNTNSNITLNHLIPGKLREGKKTDLRTTIVINSNGIIVLPNSLELSRDRQLDQLVGMNDYGTLFILKGKIDSTEQRGTNLIINQPLIQRFAEVVVKAYE